MCSKMLETLYHLAAASAVYFEWSGGWGGMRDERDTSRLNELIRKAGSVIGCKLDSFEAEVEMRSPVVSGSFLMLG